MVAADALPEGQVAPTGATGAGVGHADRGFPRSQPAPRALQTQPPNQPPLCANAVMKPPRRLTTAPRSEDSVAKKQSQD